MRKLWSDKAWEDYLYWQSQDKKTLKRINNLLRNIERSASDSEGHSKPFGKAERLKYSQTGLLSVRIDSTNRLVYKIDESTLFVVSCRGHYK